MDRTIIDVSLGAEAHWKYDWVTKGTTNQESLKTSVVKFLQKVFLYNLSDSIQLSLFIVPFPPYAPHF